MSDRAKTRISNGPDSRLGGAADPFGYSSFGSGVGGEIGGFETLDCYVRVDLRG